MTTSKSYGNLSDKATARAVPTPTSGGGVGSLTTLLLSAALGLCCADSPCAVREMHAASCCCCLAAHSKFGMR